MSTGRSNAMDALPRASLLTYFRRPHPLHSNRYRQRSSSRYSMQSVRAPSLPGIPEDTDAELDEESQLGFWGEHPPKYDDICENDEGESEDADQGYGWGLWEISSLICYVLLIFFLVLNVDTFLGKMGVGTGPTAVPGDGMASAQLDSQDMHFCLTASNRAAPTSRVWRFIPAYSHEDCDTQVITLHAGPTEEWKLLQDDVVLFGDGTGTMGSDTEESKFIATSISGEDKYVTHDSLGEDLGDDLIKESGLREWREAALVAVYERR